MPPKSDLTAPNTPAAELSIGIRLPNYVGVVNHGFAITKATLSTALENVKDPLPKKSCFPSTFAFAQHFPSRCPISSPQLNFYH